MDSGGERNEWPTEQRLVSLRARGVVAISWSSIYCAGILGFLVGVALMRSRIEALYHSWASALATNSALTQNSLGEIFVVVAAPAVAAFLFCIIVGLVQSKFLFRLGAVGVDFGKIAAPAWWSGVKTRAVSGSIGAAVWLIVGLGVAAILALFAYREFLTLFNHEWRWVLQRLISLGSPIFWGITVLAFFAVIVAWLIERFRFMLKHRMSRKELEHETEELHIT